MNKRISLFLLVLICCTLAYAADHEYKSLEGNDPVCAASINYLNRLLGDNLTFDDLGIEFMSATKEKSDFKLPAPIVASQLKDFDLNNDGIPDRIFYYSNAGSYIFGTMLYVVFGDKVPLLNPQETLDTDLLHVFPCQFDKNVTSSSKCPPISQGSDEAGIDVTFPKKRSVHFRGRYTEITAIRFQNKTYLILQSNSEDTNKYGAVIKPYGNSNYASACLFKKP